MLANFFKKDVAGLFFSSKGMVIIQQAAGKIKNQLGVPYPVKREDTTGIFSDDIFELFKNKETEMIAFLQKSIRDSRIDTSSVVVALPPKDLIIRFFEMPNIPRSEVLAGINFEMKKYIPFKIEELAYDFQYRVKQKANIIEVVLCGIKQDPIDKYIGLFRQLNLNVVAFEPALFSLFRLLVIKNKILSTKSYVILEFDQQEANILIAEKGFPYFTRDIKLISTASAVKEDEGFDAILFRLINEVRVSLDYYRRQFMKRDIDEMIVISNKSYSSWVDNFSKELGLKVSFVALNDLFKIKDVKEDMLSDIAKAYGAALRIERPSLVTLNLGKAKEKADKLALAAAAPSGEDLQVLFTDFLKQSKASILKGLAIGVAIFLAGYGMSFSKLFPLEKQLATASVKQLPLLPGVDLSSLESIQSSERVFNEKQRDFSKLVVNNTFFYKKVLLLSRLMPTGVWLTGLDYSANPHSLKFHCYSYDADQKMRSENINKFILNLKGNNDFSKDTPSIELKSYREVNVGKVYYMQFDVTCENKSEKIATIGGI
ncbi:MAG: pilus assembly protein PilM [Candidatus Omnitrophota bacterium]